MDSGLLDLLLAEGRDNDRIRTLERVRAELLRRRAVARQHGKQLEKRIAELEREVGELTLIAHALFHALCETKTLDKERLFDTLHELDVADGKADGQYRPPRRKTKAKPRGAAAKSPTPKAPARLKRLRKG